MARCPASDSDRASQKTASDRHRKAVSIIVPILHFARAATAGALNEVLSDISPVSPVRDANLSNNPTFA
tara:strand:+ start:55 stop:261 length:207 start_codon:yes stop_codon:yes gene_type:complete